MDDLKYLVNRKNDVNWIRFFKSNLAVFRNHTIKERQDFIRQYIDQIDCFSYAAQVCEVSTDFVRQFLDHWQDNDLFYSVQSNQYSQFFDRVKRSWGGMAVFFGDMNEDVLQKHKEVVQDWRYVLQNRHFSSEFIDRNIEYLIAKYDENPSIELWNTLSFYQPNLSEQFIDTYQKNLDWELMSANQKFSDSIVLKYKNKIFWELLVENKNVIITYPIEKIIKEREARLLL